MTISAILRRPAGGAVTTAARLIAGAIVTGGVLAALGPFGSYLNDGPARRTAYWIAAMLLGLILYGTAFAAVAAIVRTGSRGWWPMLVGATLIASIPQALATRTAAFWLWPVLERIGPSMPVWFAQTAMIGATAMTVATLLHRRAGPVAGSTPADAVATTPATNSLGRDVLALQMEDHYVRVHRHDRSDLVLMPLGRAIEQLDADGLRTHRSWWVASHAVEAVEGDARSMRLRLSNGVVAPVARSAVTHLKSAGWLSRRR